uniref:NTC-1 (inferred by orthology to a C. elegans protein) n=1 Tax=Strongyloides venezuelensis TaxID=75913 RepID=A0A0K0FAS5_STRVS
MKKTNKINNYFTFIIIVSLLFETTNCCFLNSCPFRRYGRNIECDTCDSIENGLCASDGLCCNANRCVMDDECLNKIICLKDQCFVDDMPGVCVFSGFCCTNGICKVTSECFNEQRKRNLRYVRSKIEITLPYKKSI